MTRRIVSVLGIVVFLIQVVYVVFSFLFHFSSKVERRVVSVLGIVVFLTRGYKSEAIMAFWASRNRDKGKEDRKRRIFGSVCFWQRIFWQRDLVCFGYAEPFSYEDIKFVSIRTLVAAVFSYFF